MNNYYLLSGCFNVAKNAPLALAITLVLSGSDGYFRKGNVLRHMNMLLQDGLPFDTQDGTEVGRWGNRSSGIDSSDDVSECMYYAYVDPSCWELIPNLTICTRPEFMELFEDCCRNFVASEPSRREEYAEALAANGLSL